MKAKIKVGFSSKVQVIEYTPVEQSDSLELEIEYEDEADLERKIEKWQDFIQSKVVKATFIGANKLLEEKKRIQEEERKIKEALSVLSEDNDLDEEDDYISKNGKLYKKKLLNQLKNQVVNYPPSSHGNNSSCSSAIGFGSRYSLGSGSTC